MKLPSPSLPAITHRLAKPLRIVGLLSLFTLHPSLFSPAQAGDLIPFTLPWNDDAPGITDLSSLNHTPAGKYGHIAVDADAHFTAGGQRVRLWGVNITAESCFPTHAEAEGIAARLAKFGFNIVRFHHMDNNWGGGSLIDYAQGNSRHLHAANLEKLDYFIAQLKAHGIYANLNLINSRDFKVADGLDPAAANLDLKSRHTLGFVDPTARDLEKEYARKLLTHVNPYTGLSYAADPTIAVVEINNENGIFQQLFDGNLALWPAPYKTQLQTKWNAWLANRYASTADLLAAWSGNSETLGPETITNGTFAANNTAGWNIEQHDIAKVTATTGQFASRQAIKLDITTTSPTGWHVQFNQSGKALATGQLYTLTFRARADTTRTFTANIGLAYAPYSGIHSFPTLTATTEWKQYTFRFQGATTDNNLRLNFSNFVGQAGPLYLTDISLRAGGDLSATLPAGQTLEAANIQTNLDSDADLPNRELDWTRFLIALATDYWTDMGSYLKNDLAYAGLVNGTTIMNSTPNIQGVFDLVDTHAYWQHPVFPGTAWDPNNWYVNPLSMVNTLDSTIGDLARQRVDGYPHTVSEYRHAYPNPFASEGPLLIGAYASLQDWDGIYFFDYAKGANGWDQGYWDGYFNMNAHPSAMANALAAAQIFRQGHVSASTGQLLFNFNPELEASLVATRGRAWNVGDGRQLDIPPEHAAIQRIALSIGQNASGLTTPPDAPSGPRYTADTGELNWDLNSPTKGVVTINTPQTRGMVGYVNSRDFELGNVRIAFGDTREDWATVTLTTRQGSFDNVYAPARILVVATGLTENTGMVWTDSTKSSVGQNWGRAPSLTEAIPATITLPYPANRTSAWALDETGQRLAPLSVSTSGGGSSLQIGGSQKSLWYEIAVEAGDPYQAWRESTWTNPTEQADDTVSGRSADPDRDGIPNLVEFLAGLDPKIRDTRSPLKQSVVLIDEKPAFVYQLLTPIDYPTSLLEVSTSSNLESWQNTPLETAPISITVAPHSQTRKQLTITYQPSSYPAFSRLSSPNQ